MTDLRYARPETLSEACAMLAEAPGRAAVLAGGTDLVLGLRSGAAGPSLLVDVKQIPELREIRWTAGGDLVLGAAVTMRRIYEDETIAAAYPALADGAHAVGSLQIRMRATVGGNLCNASPCMDTAPPLLVLGAELQLLGAGGERRIPLEGFFVDVKRTVLAPGELLASVVVPAASRPRGSAFGKVKRGQGHDLALVNAAASYDPEARTLRAAIGSCGTTPIVLPALEGLSSGPAAAAAATEQLAASARRHVCPIDDVRAGAEYRAEMAAMLCRRLAERLLGGKGEGR